MATKLEIKKLLRSFFTEFSPWAFGTSDKHQINTFLVEIVDDMVYFECCLRNQKIDVKYILGYLDKARINHCMKNIKSLKRFIETFKSAENKSSDEFMKITLTAYKIFEMEFDMN